MQMEAVADWSEHFGFGEIRIAHEQNIVLPDVPKSDLFTLWRLACEQNLGSANVGLLTDIIACPGGDFCALANAKSIPIAQAIQARFEDLDYLHDLGDISLNISGCMNACGHHHIGNIGILGVDKNGSEWYQITSVAPRARTVRWARSSARRSAPPQVPAVDRADHRHVRALPRKRGAVCRHLGAHRPGAVQGGGLPESAGGVGMNNLLRLEEGVARIVEDDPGRWFGTVRAPLPEGQVILPVARWLENPQQNGSVAGAGR